MTTKLTLTIEENVISSAKRFAQKKGKSLSQIVESYLQTVSNSGTDKEMKLSQKTKKLLGAVKLPKGLDYKAELGKAISRKYK
jgi:hypothetical protein